LAAAVPDWREGTVWLHDGAGGSCSLPAN